MRHSTWLIPRPRWIRPSLVTLAVSLSLASCASTQRAAPADPAGSSGACRFDAKPTVIEVDEPIPGELHLAYHLVDTPRLWAPAPQDGQLKAYREALRARIGGSLAPADLAKRQRDILLKDGSPRARREAANGTAVAEGRVGHMEAASCLDLLLFRVQARRFPMIEHPTEFGAFVLKRGEDLRVYFSGADRVGQKLRGAITERVKADVAAGFELVAHLHNHPFLFDRVVGDRMWSNPANLQDIAGALAPSTVDVQLYRRFRDSLGLRAAWITNGLDSVRIPAEEFGRLASE